MSTGESAVDVLVAALGSAREGDIQRLRELIRATDARVTESVKWNSPNYELARADGSRIDFATLNLRPGAAVRVVLHTGARPDPAHPELVIDDPEGLLEWRGRDRAVVTFGDTAALDAHAAPFAALLHQWVAQL
jgi:hypothetical protein